MNLFVFFSKIPKKEWVFWLVVSLFCIGLWYVPPVDQLAASGGYTVPAEVLSTDDSLLMQHGLLPYGSQHLSVKILSGKMSGQVFPAVNELRGQPDLDKLFSAGDRITVIIDSEDAVIAPDTVLTARDFDRSLWTIVLFGVFCLLLIVFGQWTGAKALFSFVFSCLVIFKAVIPLTLKGIPASWTIFAAVVILTLVIVFLVAGVTKKAFAASAGALSGVFAGLLMAHCFGELLHINGTSMPFVQTLLYNGFETLDLADIFTGTLILGCSGAVMDLAMDIASSMEEVCKFNPELSAKELISSGFRVGRSVVGTMTTTLLLAYSGGFLTLLMMFAVQGTHFVDVINHPLVAAEIIKTLIGSFSLVLVAPFTAVAGGIIFKK